MEEAEVPRENPQPWAGCLSESTIFVFKQIIRRIRFRPLLSTSCVRFVKTMSNYNVIFVLGGPGAGKGTQCEKIVQDYGYVHLSAGDLLRQERNRAGSEFGEEIQTHIKNGTIVPVQITCSLLKRAMESSGKQTFLIDGFPRNQDNLDGWNKEMNDVSTVKMVLFFNCSEEVCVQRCLSRGQTSGRVDDNLDSLKKRIQTYSNSTMPIIEHYRKLNLVQEIHGEKSTDEVFEEVKKGLSNLQL